MITIIITSYKEPKSTLRAVKAFLSQKIKGDYKIIVVDPFQDVEKFIKKSIKNKKVEFFLDPGEGKSYALNQLFQENFSSNKNDIIILTDGDVYVSDNSVSEILKQFKNPKVGCITGRPMSVDSRETMYGYWANLLYEAIHKVRVRLFKEKKFFQCSGYLFAIRNGVLFDFPTNVPEDAIIPYLFWKSGYQIAYADKAEVYVKYPSNWKDWVNQRVRTIKAHENLNTVAPQMPRTKSFFNEIKEGAIFALKYPKNPHEFLWTMNLYFARLYIYFRAFTDMKRKKEFKDGWRETEINSTKPLD
jgi:cellulose synthase/poly-beta-1,6-N-acetylglucosamine synthase-like glycosyltransferase